MEAVLIAVSYGSQYKAGDCWSPNVSVWWGICYLEVTQSKLFACFCCFNCRNIRHFYQLPDEERKVSGIKYEYFPKLMLKEGDSACKEK
jgi:hypothetical protein